ncbi:MAG TPA: glutathione S-transferase family protein [Stenotrophobium sp.]|jgi:glutathione S-transferase|nr:glutathione S-transferase family protein [Stenotrophobium sp.]
MTMILIGMFDSPFVRRVAVSMKLLGMDYAHRNWSVGKDFDRIREFNPLGRVPTLVLDSGEALIESAMILDHLDERAGADRRLLPATGEARRKALRVMAFAIGAAEKGVAQIYEGAWRPREKWHQPWVDRCNAQMHGALAELENACTQTRPWLLGEKISQADITLACVTTFLSDTVGFGAHTYPALQTLVSRCEALPEFRAVRVPFYTPSPQ